MIVYATLEVPAVMLLEAFLSFLGLGRSGAAGFMGQPRIAKEFRTSPCFPGS